MKYTAALTLVILAGAPSPARAQVSGADEPGLELPSWAEQEPPRPLDKPPPVPAEDLRQGVLARLHHASPARRWAAVVAVGQGGYREAVPMLTRLMVNDTALRVRIAAAWALGHLKARNAVPNLQAVAWHDPEAAVRDMARSALNHMGHKLKPGPYWEWPQYQEARSKRTVGIGVLAGGGGLGVGLLILALVGGVECELDGGLFANNDCTEWGTVAIFGGVSIALGVIIGVPTWAYYQSKMNKVIPAWVDPLPVPMLSATRDGGRVGLTWRF